MGCSSLNDIRLPDGLKEIGLRAFRESGLQNILIPSSMRTIHQSAFCKCQNLRCVVINEGLEVLGTDEYTKDSGRWYGVFEESSLNCIELPQTLKRIEYSTFEGCSNLKSI